MSLPTEFEENFDLVELDSTEMNIPVLPDDLMMMIFDELTTEERAPIGSTCWGFRILDMDLGKKMFDYIEISDLPNRKDQLKKTLRITGISANKKYTLHLNNNEMSANLGPFKKATTKLLDIEHESDTSHVRPSEILINSNFKIAFEKLCISLKCVNHGMECTESHSEMIFSTMFGIKSLTMFLLRSKVKEMNEPEIGHSEQIQIPIPELPDDIMLMIFEELTTKERSHLGTTSKRFRELDFELGKRNFESIKIFDVEDVKPLRLIGIIANAEYRVNGNAKPYHNIRLFRQAKTKLLKIWHKSPSPSELVISVCSLINFEKLRVSLRCGQETTERFVNALISNRNIAKAEVFLRLWICGKEFSPEIKDRARKMILQLPKMDKLRLEWSIRFPENNYDYIMDDAMLLHFVRNTNHVVLEKSNWSTQGLLDAFEVVDKSSGYKFVASQAPKSSVDQLFVQTNQMLTTGVYSLIDSEWRYAFNLDSRAIFWAKYNNTEESFLEVLIGKQNENNSFIVNKAFW